MSKPVNWYFVPFTCGVIFRTTGTISKIDADTILNTYDHGKFP